MSDFIKTVRLGTMSYRDDGKAAFHVFCRIKFEGGRLSISGVEGPLPSGNARGSCGQIDMHMDGAYQQKLKLAPGWTREKVARFLEIWKLALKGD